MPVVRYSLLRFALFAALFWVLYLLGANWALAAGLSVVIAAAVSYLFLRRWRDSAAQSIAARVETTTRNRRGRTGRFASSVAHEEAREDAATSGDVISGGPPAADSERDVP